MKYLKAPSGWAPEVGNPFSSDGRYGDEWICFRIHPTDDHANCCGGGRKSVYTLCLGRKTANLNQRLSDFLRYGNGLGRNVILSFPENMNVDSFVQESLGNAEANDFVRKDDPKWVVHSTSLEAWSNIRKDGMLKSRSVQEKEGCNSRGGIGFDLLGETPEFVEYIMFGTIDSLSPEFVVASQKAGRILTEADAEYQPGARLYFDNHQIIRKGLAVRDGIHTMKIHRRLSLVPFLVAAVSAAELESEKNVPYWTPQTFISEANLEFQRKAANQQKENP
jgi:hypothetical protein